MMKKEQIKQLAMFGLAKVGDGLYFYNYLYGCVIKIKNESVILDYIESSEKAYECDLYGGATVYNNRIVFSPRCANEILIYNTVDKTAERIQYNTNSLHDGKLLNQFITAHQYGEYVYFFPGRNDEIIRMNKSTYELKYISGWSEAIGEIPICGSVKFANARMVDQETVMLPCYHYGLVLEFNMRTEEYKVHSISDEPLSDIAYDGKVYWVTLKNRAAVIRWEKEGNSNKIEMIGISPESALAEKGYTYIVDDGDFLYLVPFKGNGLVKWSKKNGEYSVIQLWGNTKQKETMTVINPSGTNCFMCEKLSPNEIYLYDSINGRIIVYDLISGEYKTIESVLQGNGFDDLHRALLSEQLKEIVNEDSEFDVKDYLNFLT